MLAQRLCGWHSAFLRLFVSKRSRWAAFAPRWKENLIHKCLLTLQVHIPVLFGTLAALRATLLPTPFKEGNKATNAHTSGWTVQHWMLATESPHNLRHLSLMIWLPQLPNKRGSLSFKNRCSQMQAARAGMTSCERCNRGIQQGMKGRDGHHTPAERPGTSGANQAWCYRNTRLLKGCRSLASRRCRRRCRYQGKRALATNEAACPVTRPRAPLGVLLTQF